MKLTMTFCGISLGLLLLTGCGPRIDEQELGKIVAEVPDIPSRYKVYELPDLYVPPAAESASDHSGHAH